MYKLYSSAVRSASGGSDRKRTRGYLWTDIPIVPDRVGAGRLRVQDRSVVFSALGGKDILIEPATSGQLVIQSH